jgi:hypothetical protein
MNNQFIWTTDALGAGSYLWSNDYGSAAFQDQATLGTLAVSGRHGGFELDVGSFMETNYDPGGRPVSYTLLSGPSYGVLEVYVGGAFQYAPNSGFVGSDTFTYRLLAGSEAGTDGTVTIEVT